MSPGQTAYQAFMESEKDHFRRAASFEMRGFGWEALPDWCQASWEAAAYAVIEQRLRLMNPMGAK